MESETVGADSPNTLRELSIVIPVYNEDENIETCLRGIHDQVASPYQILIVYDFDEDKTLPVASRVRDELGLHLKFLRNRYGKGALGAIKTGLHSADTKYVVVTMADLSDPPAVMNRMLSEARRGRADLVCASRYMREGRQIGGPFVKTTLSRLAGLSLFHLTSLPTHDPTNSFKLYTKKVIDAFEIESTGGFELGLELVVKAHFGGFRVAEVPTVWTDRACGESRFRLIHWLPNYLKWYVFALKNNWLS